MKGWTTKTLADVCEKITDGSHRTPPFTAAGYPFVTVVHLDNDGKIDLSSCKRISREDFDELRKNDCRPLPGDVLFSKDGTVGKVAVIDFDTDFVVLSSLAILRPKKDLLDQRFLAYALRSESVLKQAIDRKSGSAIRRIVLRDLRGVSLSVPRLVDQKRIVSLLDDAEELQKLRSNSERVAARLVPALFDEMFGDPAENPKGWPIRTAGELMTACDYGTSKKASEAGRGVPVLRMGNVTTAGKLDLEDLKTVELDENELGKQKLRAGDVLFNRTNSRELVGKTGMWDGRYEAVAASYFIRVRFRADVEHPQHFTTYMNLPFMKRRLAEMARGAVGQANINAQELKSIQVPVPPMPLQKEFAERVSEIRELEVEQVASRNRLDGLFQSMLHRAFSGEL
jgi:type I restriction enzyme S subunit